MKTMTRNLLLLAAGMIIAGPACLAQDDREARRAAAFQRERERGGDPSRDSSRESSRGEFNRDSSRGESNRDSSRGEFNRDSSRGESSRDSSRSDPSRDSSRDPSRDPSRGDTSRDFRSRDVRERGSFGSGSTSSRFSGPGANSTPAGPESAGFNEFAVIRENNIFVRNRRVETPRQVASSEMTPDEKRRQEESSYVLRGIAIQDNTYLGVIENTRTIETKKVQIGDSIAQGKITEMALDYLEYESSSGTRTRVQVGFNLAGGSPTYTSSSGSSSSSSLPSSPEEAAMIERMKAKRAAEGRR